MRDRRRGAETQPHAFRAHFRNPWPRSGCRKIGPDFTVQQAGLDSGNFLTQNRGMNPILGAIPSGNLAPVLSPHQKLAPHFLLAGDATAPTFVPATPDDFFVAAPVAMKSSLLCGFASRRRITRAHELSIDRKEQAMDYRDSGWRQNAVVTRTQS